MLHRLLDGEPVRIDSKDCCILGHDRKLLCAILLCTRMATH
jgi:hypothetical protein